MIPIGMKTGISGSGVPKWLDPGTHDSLMHGEYSGVR